MSANTISVLLVFAVIAIGLIGYYLGRSVGREEGYGRGYIEGGNNVTDKVTQGRTLPRASKPQVYPRSNVSPKSPKSGKVWY